MLGGLSRLGVSPPFACRFPSNYEDHIIEKIVPYVMSGFAIEMAALCSSISSNHHILNSNKSTVHDVA